MMSEFSFSDNRASDWDLHAIVKGRVTTTPNNNTMNNDNMLTSYDAWFEPLDNQGHENSTFIFDKHEPLIIQSVSTNSTPQTIVDSSMMNFNMDTTNPIDEPKKKATHDSYASSARATISKRRKNKHKIIKVVQQEGGDRVMCDKWNWRKYGEKVIKGSPYPRSYYRCSNPGGCSAKKQVEQSISDPELILITYMEEHCHPYPTRRHSQAGRCARRFNNTSSTTKLVSISTTNEPQNTSVSTKTSESSSNKNDQALVPPSDEDDGSSVDCVGRDQVSVCMGNSVCEDDFFVGLDYLLEGLIN